MDSVSCRGGSCGRPPEGHPQEVPLQRDDPSSASSVSVRRCGTSSQRLDELASELLFSFLQLPAEALPLGVFGCVTELLLEIPELRYARLQEVRKARVVQRLGNALHQAL